ncbi:hypothetical protein [Nocardia sp. NPDC051570]|uniref:hypothetical protein n=1 Tax=Nocardia sp. NPDC051570 TaxID=3364324 RepID=UPI0037AFD28D
MTLGVLEAVGFLFDADTPKRISAVDLRFGASTWRFAPTEDGTATFAPRPADAAGTDVTDCFPWPRATGLPADYTYLCDAGGGTVGVQLDFGDPTAVPTMVVQLRIRSGRVEVNAVYALEIPLRAVVRRQFADQGTPEARFRLSVHPEAAEAAEITLEPTGMEWRVDPGTWVDVEVLNGDGTQPEVELYTGGQLSILAGTYAWVMTPDGRLID